MKIKDFFKYLVLGASLNPAPVFADRLVYPLESTPDFGTVLDEEKAAKVRKLVEHAITRPNKRGVVQYVKDYIKDKAQSENLQDVLVAIVVGDTKYTLLIQNNPVGQHDALIIYQRPKGRYNINKVKVFSDTGLDGRCEFQSQGCQPLYDETLDRLIDSYERYR